MFVTVIVKMHCRFMHHVVTTYPAVHCVC